MLRRKLSQAEVLGPPQPFTPAGAIKAPVQVTVGFACDTVPEVGVAPLATAETRRRIDARTAARTGERPLTLLEVGRGREGIFSSFNDAIRRACRGPVESTR